MSEAASIQWRHSGAAALQRKWKYVVFYWVESPVKCAAKVVVPRSWRFV
jgi:hypothetical protein